MKLTELVNENSEVIDSESDNTGEDNIGSILDSESLVGIASGAAEVVRTGYWYGFASFDGFCNCSFETG